MHLVGSAQHYGLIERDRLRVERKRMHDTLVRSGYDAGPAGTVLPDIEYTALRGDFLIYVGRDGKRDMLAISDLMTQEYAILTCRGGLAGLESTIEKSAAMPALLRSMEDDPELGRFHEPLSRFY